MRRGVETRLVTPNLLCGSFCTRTSVIATIAILDGAENAEVDAPREVPSRHLRADRSSLGTIKASPPESYRPTHRHAQTQMSAELTPIAVTNDGPGQLGNSSELRRTTLGMPMQESQSVNPY
jgi:hypothetical protein